MDIIEERRKTILELIKTEGYSPMKISEMAYFMEVPQRERGEFEYILRQMEKDGDITLTKRGKIMALSQARLVKGQFLSSVKGYGFVVQEDGLSKDVFIPAKNLNGAMHKDIVVARIIQEEGPGFRAEGEIVKIITRVFTSIVGVFQQVKGFGFVRPDDPKISGDIYISSGDTMGAVTGHKVVAKIIKDAKGENSIQGKITEILGHANDPSVEILSIIRKYKLGEKFPESALRAAEEIPDEIALSDMKGRLDLRDLVTVTIDGDDAKDLDDAVTLEKIGSIYRLGVHIADVTHYVKEGGALDKEALNRGTSVYLSDRVLPMLPHRLSNGICSLNPHVDRLTLSCIMDIDERGNVISHQIAETVININKRLSYEGVDSAFEANSDFTWEYGEYLPLLNLMAELSAILREKRVERGAIEFDFPESKIVTDHTGRVVDIVPRKRTLATGIIEEFMLAANETVAQNFYWQETPFVYRSHAKPDSEKVDKLSEFLSVFGYSFKGRKNHPKKIQDLLSKYQYSPEAMIINRVVLRSMKQARYTPLNEGHFGLAADHYCHFTSPIRRYPDLQIHRIIKDSLNGRLDGKRLSHYEKILPEVCRISSFTERNAEEAERDVVNFKKIQYMEDKIGQVYWGFISGVTSWGLYVELENTVEGLVSFSDIDDDYYVIDEKNYQAAGEQLGRVYKLGQRVKIEVTKADLAIRRLNFRFVEED